jgi:hypothetical protein
MIGNRVRVILVSSVVTGILHKLDQTGAMVYREHELLPEARGLVFLPMHRIIEIIDLGRAP